MFDLFSPEQCPVVYVYSWRRERSILKNLLICTFYLALFKLEIFCNHKQLLDRYFAQRISSVCRVRGQTNFLLLLTEYCQAWIFLFTITGIKMPLPELCSVYILIWETKWLEANPDLDVLTVYTKDSREMLTVYMGWGSVPCSLERGWCQSLVWTTTWD